MSNQFKGTGDSASVAIAYIQSLVERFEKAEKHIDDDIAQIENRLKQLVELVKTVSSIQHQVASQQQTIIDLRNEIRENMEQLQALMTTSDGKYASNFSALSKKIGDVVADQTAARKKVESRVSSLENRLQTWLNRGIGAWTVFTLVIGTLQYMGLQYVNSLQAERQQLHAAIGKSAAHIADLEMRQQALERQQQVSQNPPSKGGADGHVQ